mmetsp:Transcript_37200/g.55440  ORF Transcript_37200/g.55440 Transcript_37200/m.55440 type:complete len:86 (+) Transcript_37200:1051-1308(+)
MRQNTQDAQSRTNIGRASRVESSRQYGGRSSIEHNILKGTRKLGSDRWIGDSAPRESLRLSKEKNKFKDDCASLEAMYVQHAIPR